MTTFQDQLDDQIARLRAELHAGLAVEQDILDRVLALLADHAHGRARLLSAFGHLLTTPPPQAHSSPLAMAEAATQAEWERQRRQAVS